KEHPEMLSILKRAKFVLFPSIWAEPLGRVLIEASMLRKPSICFSHPGGHHDVVQHKANGLMVKSNEEFSEAVAQVANDSELCRALGEAGRRIYEEQFSPDAVIPKLLEFYPERYLYTRLAARGATAPQPRFE